MSYQTRYTCRDFDHQAVIFRSLKHSKTSFEVCQPRSVGSMTKILCITHTVDHNYISPSSTVGIELHVSALYVGHLQVVI